MLFKKLVGLIIIWFQGASLALLVTHDDYQRDIPYTLGAEKAVASAREHSWSLVSVRDDWAKVFVD